MTKKLIIFICLISALALPQMVLAGTDPWSGEEYTETGKSNPALGTLDNVAVTKGPYSQAADTTLTGLIGTIIGVALSLVGVIFLVLMIFAGYNWMTAQGEEEKVAKAKSTIIQSIIGIIIVIGSYAAWAFIFSKLF